MSDIITVMGAPGSGQTTVALKLAVETYNALKNVSVLFVSMDYIAPSIACLFPNKRTEQIVSAASLLDKPEMSADNVLRNIVTVPNMKNFGVLGLKAGENKNSYPIPDRHKVETLFNVLQREFDFIFVDYIMNEELSRYALGESDRVIRVLSPDVKSIAWLMSSRSIINDTDNRLLNCINVIEKDSCTPTEEVATQLKNVTTILPYSKLIRQQSHDGELWLTSKEKAYGKRLQVLVEKMLDPAGKGRDSRAEEIESSGFGA